MKLIRNVSATPAGDGPGNESAQRHPWKILVVDDESDVRALTRLNLKGFEFDGKGLEIIEAASAALAREKLQTERDIAVALVDVVMETEDAGLRLVEYIRKDLNNRMIRLVIRTGQPGAAPERFVIDNFDIDDYKDKTELTATRLYTTVRSALKAYRDLKTIDLNRIGLTRVLQAAPDLYKISNSSLNAFFEGVLTQIIGLCNLADVGFISTVDGMLATIDGQEIKVHATAGKITDVQRLNEIRQSCIRALENSELPAHIRQNGLVVPLAVHSKQVGFVYVEPTRTLSEDDIQLLTIMAQQCSSALENLHLHLDLEKAYDDAIEMLAEIAEFKDKNTGGHVKRIETYTRLVAQEMGIPELQAIEFGKASRLHDVGKIGIPDHILRKPGKLTDEEFDVMKTHVSIGVSILSHNPALATAMEIAEFHHERWDGAGYLSGCRSEHVSLVTRIVSVVDVFDALLSRRPYKEAWTIQKAVATIEEGAGSQFDPAVVTAFLALYRRGAFDRLVEAEELNRVE